MKAVVTEVKNGQMTLLAEDWTVIEMEGALEVGEELEIPDAVGAFAKEKKLSRRAIRYAAFAAAVLLAVLAGAGTYSTTVYAASSISVDSDNASVTLSLNRLGRVVSVSASGDGAEDLVNRLREEGIRNDRLPEAIGKVSRNMKDLGYMEEDDHPGIGLKAENEKVYEKLRKQIEQEGMRIGPKEVNTFAPVKEETVEEKPEDISEDTSLSDEKPVTEQMQSVSQQEPENEAKTEEIPEQKEQQEPAGDPDVEPAGDPDTEPVGNPAPKPEGQEYPEEHFQEYGPESPVEEPPEQYGQEEEFTGQEPPQEPSGEEAPPQIEPGRESGEQPFPEQPGPGPEGGDPGSLRENNPGRSGGDPMPGGDRGPSGGR